MLLAVNNVTYDYTLVRFHYTKYHMAEKFDGGKVNKFNEWLSVHQTFLIKILSFSISKHTTLKEFCVLHSSEFFTTKLL